VSRAAIATIGFVCPGAELPFRRAAFDLQVNVHLVVPATCSSPQRGRCPLLPGAVVFSTAEFPIPARLLRSERSAAPLAGRKGHRHDASASVAAAHAQDVSQSLLLQRSKDCAAGKDAHEKKA
jgi:hypothetical protein